MLDFDPGRPPVAPRPAASTLVLRQGASGPELLCIVRHPRSGFMGGVLAFPGGKVDAEDSLSPSLTDGLDPRLSSLDSPAAPPLALAVAACRELLEEAAILPTTTPVDHERALQLRAALEHDAVFSAVLEANHLTLATSRLVPFGRWVTPEAEPRRYDATFFLLALPEGQTGKSDAHETTDAFWATPESILGRWALGELSLAPPQSRTLELLAQARSLDEIFALAAQQSLLPIRPRFFLSDGAPGLALPGDPEHELRERRIEGPTRFVLRDGRFVADPAYR